MCPDASRFDLQPVLRGELVEVRPLRGDDFTELFAVASDPLIWEQHPARDRYTEERFREFFQEAMECGGAFAILDAHTAEIIGSSRYFGLDAEQREVEIGWTFLGRAYWGGRYNAELKRLMLEHAFRYVSRVIFLVGPQNFRSQRAVEKIGGICTGAVYRDGRESMVFEITADAFARAPLSAP